MLRSTDSILAGSTVLSVLRPGPWTPDDLDVVTCPAEYDVLQAHLVEQGYVEDEKMRRYPWNPFYPEAARRRMYHYRRFFKGPRKIDVSVALIDVVDFVL